MERAKTHPILIAAGVAVLLCVVVVGLPFPPLIPLTTASRSL